MAERARSRGAARRAARASAHHAPFRSQDGLLTRFTRRRGFFGYTDEGSRLPAFSLRRESDAGGVYCVYLDRKNHPLGRHLITLGTATTTLVSPKEVFRGAIVAGAVAIVIAHNHPSGDPAPSTADIQVTRQLREASRLLDIQMLDHVFAVKRKPIRTVAVSTPFARRASCEARVFAPGGSPPGVTFTSHLFTIGGET